MLYRRIKLLLLCAALLTWCNASAYKEMTREQYIALHKDDAVRDMMRTGVPASITLAQALLESKDGNSPLAREANNHFGIKCTSDWRGDSYTQDDDRKDECFRKYNSVLDSYDDHSCFLKTRPRYASLFDIDKTDYKKWAKGLKKSGYATNPHYADELIKIIEDFKLDKLDCMSADNMTASAAPSAPCANVSTENHVEQTPPQVVKEKVAVTHISNASPSYRVDPFSETRKVMTNNGVPYIIARKGDTYEKITKEYEMMPWLIYKYNDVPKTAVVKEGQMIYIKPKARKYYAGEDLYVAKEGDSMQSISQQFGMKMKFLYKRNNLDKDAVVYAGERLWLK